MPITPEETELCLQLFEDVHLMEQKQTNGLPSSSQIRIVHSVALRRWIVDGAFYRVQKLLTSRVLFEFQDSSQEIEECKQGANEYWGAVVNSGNVAIGWSQYSKVVVEQIAANTYKRPEPRSLAPIKGPAKEFFNQHSFFWKGQFYTRVDLIKFLANKLGGAHYDFDRNKSEAHIEEIQNTLENPQNIKMLVGPDVFASKMDASKRPFIYDAIQLHVADTADIFCKAVRQSETEIRKALF